MDERTDELIALAALGELSEADEAELDALLAADTEIVGELDEAIEVAAALLGTVADDPPARLKASVLDAIASTPQTTTDSSWVDEPPTAGDRVLDEAPVESTVASAQVIDLSARRRRRMVSALGVAAAMVLLAGVGIIFTRDDSVGVEDRVAVDSVIEADDAVTRVLEGELEGTLTVVYSPGEEALVIDGAGLPVLGEDRAFVLWFVDEDSATPVQIFQPDASGDVLVRVDDVDPSDFVLGITEEDATGSDTPTEPILALA